MSRLLPCAGAQPRAQPTASARPCPAAVQRAVHTCLALSSAGCLLSILAGVEGPREVALFLTHFPAGHVVLQGMLSDSTLQTHGSNSTSFSLSSYGLHCPDKLAGIQIGPLLGR